MINGKEDLIQSAVSYGSGGTMITFATLADLASNAQALALIAGSLIVLIRLIHDVVALIRFIKNKEGE